MCLFSVFFSHNGNQEFAVYYGGSIRHFDIKSGKHIGVTPLTGKKV